MKIGKVFLTIISKLAHHFLDLGPLRPMLLDHISNRDIDKLHELIFQLDKIIFKLKPEADVHTELKNILAEIKFDIDGLQHLIEQQATLINKLTPSSYLKGVVNSVLDSMSVDDTLAELKAKK